MTSSQLFILGRLSQFLFWCRACLQNTSQWRIHGLAQIGKFVMDGFCLSPCVLLIPQTFTLLRRLYVIFFNLESTSMIFWVITHVVYSTWELIVILFYALWVLQNMEQMTLIGVPHRCWFTFATQHFRVVYPCTVLIIWIPTTALSWIRYVRKILIKLLVLVWNHWRITGIRQRVLHRVGIIRSIVTFVIDSYVVFCQGGPIVITVTIFVALSFVLHFVEYKVIGINVDFVDELIKTCCGVSFHVPYRQFLHDLWMFWFILLDGLLLLAIPLIIVSINRFIGPIISTHRRINLGTHIGFVVLFELL